MATSRIAAQRQRESSIEGKLVKACEALRVYCVKNQKKLGFLDRTFFWFNGVVDVVECKRPKGGVYSVPQLKCIRKLLERGHNVFAIDTEEKIKAYIAYRSSHGRAVGLNIGTIKWQSSDLDPIQKLSSRQCSSPVKAKIATKRANSSADL